MNETQQACQDLYESVYGEAPKVGGMVTPDGDLVYVYQPRAAGLAWYPLCPVVSGEAAERLEFEIFPELIIESDPNGLMEVVLAAQGIDPGQAVDTTKLFFKIIQESGWSGPTTQLPGIVPGNVCVTWKDQGEAIEVKDIKTVLAQLKDPDFNGLLVAELLDGETYVWNLKDSLTIEVEETAPETKEAG